MSAGPAAPAAIPVSTNIPSAHHGADADQRRLSQAHTSPEPHLSLFSQGSTTSRIAIRRGGPEDLGIGPAYYVGTVSTVWRPPAPSGEMIGAPVPSAPLAQMLCTRRRPQPALETLGPPPPAHLCRSSAAPSVRLQSQPARGRVRPAGPIDTVRPATIMATESDERRSRPCMRRRPNQPTSASWSLAPGPVTTRPSTVSWKPTHPRCSTSLSASPGPGRRPRTAFRRRSCAPSPRCASSGARPHSPPGCTA